MKISYLGCITISYMYFFVLYPVTASKTQDQKNIEIMIHSDNSNSWLILFILLFNRCYSQDKHTWTMENRKMQPTRLFQNPTLGMSAIAICYFKLIISNQKFTIVLEDHPAVVYYKSMGKLLQNRANIYVIIVNNKLS